jgi:hypothetical protein
MRHDTRSIQPHDALNGAPELVLRCPQMAPGVEREAFFQGCAGITTGQVEERVKHGQRQNASPSAALDLICPVLCLLLRKKSKRERPRLCF